jgi:hypothetical protein
MSENIKPNATSEFYNTLIPSLDDNANIQEALRMYHYGTTDGSIPEEAADINADSVAAYLGNLQTQINDLDLGSTYSISEPEVDDNGYIWVDADSAAPIFGTPPASVPSVAKYQNAAPTSGLQDGMLWVDKDAVPLKLYVYDATLAQWKVIV